MYQPAYARHRLYRGSWNDVGYGGGGYGGSGSGIPLGWGLGTWGLGAMAYDSGYLPYSNPYFSNSYGLYGNYNYTQPIPVNYWNSVVTSGTSDVITCVGSATAAVGAFKQTNYDAALDVISRGLIVCPDDSVLHELRALVLFATGDYQKSAATIHSVLAVGPGWNWATLCGMYPDVSIYTAQLRSLEKYRNEHPQDAAPRFLLAYHYMVGGHPDAAAGQLRKVAKLEPNDRIAAEMLRMLSKPADPSTVVIDQQPTPLPPDTDSKPAGSALVKPIDPATLVGTWHAIRGDGSKFEMTLTNDSQFIWKFTRAEQMADFRGKYTVDGNVLALEQPRGGSLIAELVSANDQTVQFKLLGAPTEDLGLNFSK